MAEGTPTETASSAGRGGKARALLEAVRIASLNIGAEILGATDADSGIPPPPAPALNPAPARPPSTGSSSRLVPGGPCMWCGVTATPQWRRPRGTNKLLCNACGIFYTRYGRLPEKSQAHPSVIAAAAAALAEQQLQQQLQLQQQEQQQQMQLEQEQQLLQPASADAALNLAPTSSAPGCGAADADSEPDVQPSHRTAPRDPTPLHAVAEAAAGASPHTRIPSARCSPRALHRCGSVGGSAPTSSTSSLGPSPHKRKDAPQPEVELLRCLEEPAGYLTADSGASSRPAVAAAAGGGPPLLGSVGSAPLLAAAALGPLALGTLQLAPGGMRLAHVPRTEASTGSAAGTAAAAAPAASGATSAGAEPGAAGGGAPPSSTLLTVAPLDLGVGMHMLGTQPDLGLAPLCLGGGGGSAFGPRMLHAGSVLPPELLLARPFSLSGGLLLDPSTLAALQAAQQQHALPPPLPLYARPPKRRERLPAGDSDDSNVSTDSHAVAAQCTDEDDGGTHAGAGGAAAAALGLSTSPPAVPALALAPPLFGRQQLLPLLPGLPLSAGGGAVFALPGYLGGLTCGFAAGGAQLAGASGPGLQAAGAAQQLQLHQQPQQQQIVFLQARRSRGPRSRASSATPSSSTNT